MEQFLQMWLVLLLPVTIRLQYHLITGSGREAAGNWILLLLPQKTKMLRKSDLQTMSTHSAGAPCLEQKGGAGGKPT